MDAWAHAETSCVHACTVRALALQTAYAHSSLLSSLALALSCTPRAVSLRPCRVHWHATGRIMSLYELAIFIPISLIYIGIPMSVCLHRFFSHRVWFPDAHADLRLPNACGLRQDLDQRLWSTSLPSNASVFGMQCADVCNASMCATRVCVAWHSRREPKA